MVRKVLLLLILAPALLLSQEINQPELFSDAIGKNIRQYRKESRLAYARKDFERAQFLFDSLVRYSLKGQYLDNFRVKRFPGRRFNLHDFEKPVYLITYASWCTPGAGELPAINSIAEKYHDQVDFVILFWGSRKSVRKMKREYSKFVHILYVDESENRNDFVIRSLKHSLGFPTAFLMTANKQILDIRRVRQNHVSEDFTTAYNTSYQQFMSGLSLLMKLEEQSQEINPNSY
jgi:thiol-disulfide isomerase/thioredoxin